MIAGFLGLVIALLLAVLRERLDDRIRSRGDAEAAFGAPVIGTIPKGWRDLPPAGMARSERGNDRTRAVEEALQLLTLNVDALREGSNDEKPKGRGAAARPKGSTVAITSTRHGDGKSTIVANLGVTLARLGLDVICVEADTHEPKLRDYLNVTESSAGLVEVALGQAEVAETLVPVALEGLATPGSGSGGGRLRLLTLGGEGASLVGVLTPARAATLVDTLRDHAEYVIFDLSPLSIGVTFRLARESENVLLIGRLGRTTRVSAEAARAVLDRLAVRHVGVVLTDPSV